MSAACVHCGGTGSLSKTLWGSLDCAYCGAAEERAAYNAWQRKTMAEPVAPDEIEGWLIYQHGKAAALEQAAKLPPVPTAKERSDADMAKGFYKQSFVYFAEEARELRARLDALMGMVDENFTITYRIVGKVENDIKPAILG